MRARTRMMTIDGRNGMSMGHMVSRVDDIRDQNDNEYIYTNAVSILRNIRNVESSEFFFFWSAARLSYFPRLTSQSSFLALSPNTIPIISQRSTDPAVSDHLIFQEKLEIELLHDTFLFLNVNNSIFLLLLTNKTYCGLDLVANLQPVSRILCSAF